MAEQERCLAGIRPMPDDTEIRCHVPAGHDGTHEGQLRDYAYPGSLTHITWAEEDRRCFHGVWPGPCTTTPGCILHTGHHGRCAT